MMLILQNVLNWSLENETEILDRTFDIVRKWFDKRLLPTLNLLLFFRRFMRVMLRVPPGKALKISTIH